MSTLTPEGATPPPGLFTAEQVEAIRKQEKDKLYGEIENLKSERKTWEEQFSSVQAELDAQRKEREEAARRQAEEAAAAEAAVQRKREEDMSAKDLLLQKEQEWRAELARIEAEREQERALRDKESKLFALQQYIQRRVSEEQANIAPELIDLVNGNDSEEVESSIATLKAKTQAIVDGIKQAQQETRASLRGVSVSGYAPVGPMDNDPAHTSLSAEDIASMPMSEWAKVRNKLGLGAPERHGNYGLFG